MPEITGVQLQKHDPERVSIFLDGVFGFGASRMLVAARNLKEGRRLTSEEIAELLRDDDIERAFGAALNFLSYRQRSKHELEVYFRRNGAESEVVTAVLERLERMGMVDDREFAKFWIRNRLASRPRGSRALKAELRQKGLESELIDDELSNIEDEEPLAYRAAQLKLRSLATLDDRTFVTRLVGHLQRRGFPFPVAAKVARALVSERSEGQDRDELLEE